MSLEHLVKMRKKPKGGVCQRDTELSLKKLQVTKTGKFEHKIHNIVLDYNLECRVNTHEPILVYINY